MRASIVAPLALVITCCWAHVTSAQQLAPPPPMNAGGLAPPSGPTAPLPQPMQTTSSPTQKQLEEAGAQDSGRGLEFVYVNVDGGVQWVGLGALSSGATVGDAGTSGIGPSVGVGAGLRLLYFTVGPRFQYAHFADWNLWTLNLDLGWHVPLGRLDPYGVVGVGYAKVPRAGEGAFAGDRGVSVSGFDVRLGGGFDYYLSNAFSLGASLDFQLLRLSRSGVALQTGDAPAAALFGSDASSVGLGATLAAVAGLHY